MTLLNLSKISAALHVIVYVLFAFLDTELVSQGLLTRQQLIDAIAVGQFTPGPCFRLWLLSLSQVSQMLFTNQKKLLS